MANAQACPEACEEELDVESKCPYLPITPTYDEYENIDKILWEDERVIFVTVIKAGTKGTITDRHGHS